MTMLLLIVMLIWGSSLVCAAAFGIAARWSHETRVFLFVGKPARMSNDLR